MFRLRLLGDRHMAALFFVIAVLAPVAAMVGASLPLSLDGPSHIYNAVVMRRLLAGDSLYRRYFDFGSPLVPNWLASVLAAVVTTPGATRWSIVIMNALILSLAVAALYFLVRQAGWLETRPGHRLYALTILMPFAVNVFLVRGFWGFLISTHLCFFAVGLLQRTDPHGAA